MKLLSRKEFIKCCNHYLHMLIGSSIIFPLINCKKNGVAESVFDGYDHGVKYRYLRSGPVRVSPDFVPSYYSLHKKGILKNRGDILWQRMKSCNICPRECGANRLKGERGFCGADSRLKIASYHPHYGEERSLVGYGGSGTVFFSNCNLRCVFCINWDVSQGDAGEYVTIKDLAGMMLSLQNRGCHNINIVTPSHYLPHMILALDIAASNGLKLPLVYNTCGWEKVEVIKLLDGIVNIYLPDFKYCNKKYAARFSSGADTYPELTKKALLEMYRQAGRARPSSDGIMYKGLMIRHLVMPHDVCGSLKIMDWIANNLPHDTYINIMSQYRPVFKAKKYPLISRPVTKDEYLAVINHARKRGLTNLDIQGFH